MMMIDDGCSILMEMVAAEIATRKQQSNKNTTAEAIVGLVLLSSWQRSQEPVRSE